MRVFIVLSLLLAACAKETATPSIVTTSSKALHSTWVSDLPDWDFDFTDLNNVTWTYQSGGQCTSHADVHWFDTENYGTVVFSNSVTLTYYPGMANCSQFDGTWTYSILPNDGLEMCPPSGNCVYFK